LKIDARENDWRLFLLSTLCPSWSVAGSFDVVVVPLAVAGAMQPILIGQAISLIRQEPNTYSFKDRSCQGAKYPGRLVATGGSGCCRHSRISSAEGRAKNHR